MNNNRYQEDGSRIIMRKIAMIAAIGVIVTLMIAGSQKAEAISKDSAIILIGDSCISEDTYKAMIPSAYVGCVGDYFHWTIARADFQHIEQYYHVVYVTQNNQHEKAGLEVQGQAWYTNGDNYAYATNGYLTVKHELEHLICECYFTSDGYHNDDKDLYPALWEEEQRK